MIAGELGLTGEAMDECAVSQISRSKRGLAPFRPTRSRTAATKASLNRVDASRGRKLLEQRQDPRAAGVDLEALEFWKVPW